jgi:hypothetical protein
MALASEQAAEVVVGLGCTLQHARPPAAGTVWWDADRNMSVPVSQAVVVARCLPVTVKADGCYVRVSANPDGHLRYEIDIGRLPIVDTRGAWPACPVDPDNPEFAHHVVLPVCWAAHPNVTVSR